VAQAVEHLLCECKALNTHSSPTKKERKEEEGKKEGRERKRKGGKDRGKEGARKEGSNT
jgi:hypothetical protein